MSVSSEVKCGTSWNKLNMALLIGAPFAVGAIWWYYKKNISPKSNAEDVTDTEIQLINDSEIQLINDSEINSQNDSKINEFQTQHELALSYKNEGNAFFKNGKYHEAVNAYDKAINSCPLDKASDLATFFQNRAAAYEQMKEYIKVKEDCTKALKLNIRYVKALQRRAKACEITNDLQQSLEDITAACILEGFKNQTTLLSADRVLKELGRKHAKEAMLKRKPMMPSSHFIKTYFSSFNHDPLMDLINAEIDIDFNKKSTGFAKAKSAFKKQNYEEVITGCQEEIASNEKYFQEATLLLATFDLFLGQHESAMKSFTKVIENELADTKLRVNALIKRASLYMQLEKSSSSLEDFDYAAKIDPTNSDVFHHRGQVHLLMERVREAIEDFEKAVQLNPNFAIAYVQKCYTEYRWAYATGNVEKSKAIMQTFQEAIRRFPMCSECYTLFAQVLTDQQDYELADQYYDKGYKVDPENGTILVHRALLQLQWNGDVLKAIDLINQAIKLDERCEFGYETLGTIEVQRGNLLRAVELFDQAIPLAKTEMEMAHLFSLRDAALAQATVAQQLGMPIAPVNM